MEVAREAAELLDFFNARFLVDGGIDHDHVAESLGLFDGRHGVVEDTGSATYHIMRLAHAIEMDDYVKLSVWRNNSEDLLAKLQGVGAAEDVTAALNQSRYELRQLRVQGRFAAADIDNWRSAIVDRAEAPFQ
jgi:hypothetical protein